mmetsp:Transcript_46355/g.73203  ORF Transcript_46355/g.73203 Transcript_46355/m.73203 type:complete len:96 (+) Transcript_46355:428-715(+)
MWSITTLGRLAICSRWTAQAPFAHGHCKVETSNAYLRYRHRKGRETRDGLVCVRQTTLFTPLERAAANMAPSCGDVLFKMYCERIKVSAYFQGPK